MSRITKRLSIAALSILFVVCGTFSLVFGMTTAEASSVGGYVNLCENGDFEKEYTSWGVNGNTPERTYDTDRASYVGKLVGPGWVQTRIWKAEFVIGCEFKVTFALKIDSPVATNDNQYLLRLKGNDGSWLNDSYVTGFGENGLLETGKWNAVTVYFAIYDNLDGTYTVKGGTDRSNYGFSYVTNAAELGYLDVAVGCGNIGSTTAWYIDDFTIEKCGNTGAGEWTNGDFETDFGNSWGVNSFAATHVWYSDAATGSHAAKQTGGGWLSNRLWSAKLVAGKVYRINLDLKAESPNATTDNQFLLKFKANDDEAGAVYGDIGCNGGIETNVYRQYVYYVKLVGGEDGSMTLFGGKTRSTLAATAIVYQPDKVSHLDIQFGCGNIGTTTAWYVDNFVCTDVTPPEPEVRYNAAITVVYEDGSAAEGFRYKLSGDYESAAVQNNVVTVSNYAGDIDYIFSKAGYVTAGGTLAEGTESLTVVLKKRQITPDETKADGNLFGYYGFEEQDVMAEMDQIIHPNGWEVFVNGTAGTVGVQVTDEESYLGNNSLKVTCGTDRFVTRIIGEVAQTHHSDPGVLYHAVYYVKGTTPGITLQPSTVVQVYTADSNNFESGWGPDTYTNVIPLGNPVAISDSEWTRIDVEFLYRFEGKKVYVESALGTQEYEFENDVTHVGYFDLSLNGEGVYYLDNAALFASYDIRVEVLDENNESVTENVEYVFTDYMGKAISVSGTYADGAYCVKGLYGTFNVQATAGGKTYTGSASKNYPDILFAEEYTASVTVRYCDGTPVPTEAVLGVYAMDGAKEIEGEYDAESGKYFFRGAMGDLQVSAFVQGAEQHRTVTLSRYEPDGVYEAILVPDAEYGLEGNSASNGNVETLNQIVMLNNTEYTYPGVSNIPVEGKWFSFGPIVSLSDEAAVGSKSLRLTNLASRLAEDDPVYARYLQDNELADRSFGDRLGYRGGNAYLLDGTVYSYTSFVKAPATETSVTFDLIYLVTCNLNNYGQFNLWCPVSVTVGSRNWEKLEMRFSFSVEEDVSANESGIYEHDRWQVVCTYTLLKNDEVLKDCTGVYGYDVYSQGQYYFYGFDGNGGLYGFNGMTDKEDTVSDGGASFGSIASVEPSYQITNGTSLLIDGATMTSLYDAQITVLDRELAPNTSFPWLKLVDRYTGEILFYEAAECFDAETGKYVVEGLFHSYDVYACDENKQVIAGLIGQSVSSEVPACVVEYEYDMVLTVTDQDGNAVTDLTVRILLANGSTVNATGNGDGTYSYSGLTGVRSITFRKAAGSENDYTFPNGVTVSSADCVKTVTVTLNVPTQSEGSSPEESAAEKAGCLGSVNGVAALGLFVLAAAALPLFRKKEKAE